MTRHHIMLAANQSTAARREHKVVLRTYSTTTITVVQIET